MSIIHRDAADALWRPGDIAICFFGIVGRTTPPTPPSPVVAINNGTGSSAGSGGSFAGRMAYRILADGDTLFGSWTTGGTTDDFAAVVSVYRGQHASTPIGKLGTSLANAGSTINVPAVTSPLDGSWSWVVGCASINANTITLLGPLSGMTFRDSARLNPSGVAVASLFDTNGIVSSWPQTGINVSPATPGWLGQAFELRADSNGSLQHVSTSTLTGITTPGDPPLPTQSRGRSFAGWVA